jgi:teichoic acid transport system permease protein
MWARREFAVALPVEQMRSAHKTTLLGSVWHLGTPLLTVAVYYLIFGKLLRVDKGIDHFLVWLTIGVFTFRLSQSAITDAATSISRNVGLIRSIKFPRALLPVSAVVSGLLGFFFELAVIVGMTAFTVGISRRWLVLPLVLVIHTALNLGLGFVAARMNDVVSDIERLIPFAFRLLQYLSGVMFPIRQLVTDNIGEHPVLERFIAWNPFLSLMDLYRWVFLDTQLDGGSVLRLAGTSLVLLWFGFRYFRAVELRYGKP